MTRGGLAMAVWLVWVVRCASLGAQEFRGVWVDAFHPGLRNAAEVRAVVEAARVKNVNAVLAQVRKRGDAYYLNGLEPVAADVEAGFDPLAQLLAEAHDTSGGRQRLEVHAWIVTYNIWNRQFFDPVQPDHPFIRHPEWLSQRHRAGEGDPVETWDGANRAFDPGHPDVQQHTFDVAMDIVRRYRVDGLHFDYLRYSDDSSAGRQPWGYHPASVARFNMLQKRAGVPDPSDPLWLAWRRDQVTALLRKTYLHCLAERPEVCVSAALICYDPAPALAGDSWTATAAYSRVLQDWRGWMEEGILDLGCPMVYKTNNSSVSQWTAFIRDHQYHRAAAIGLGWYLNPVEQTIEQIKMARSAGWSGERAAGLIGYSHAVTNSSSLPSSIFALALTDDAMAELFDPGGAPVFGDRVDPPSMPWKSDLSVGALMGTIRRGSLETLPIDGAVLALSGPVERTMVSDGTGFFGTVGLPVGTYTLTASAGGFRPQQLKVQVAGAAVMPIEVTLPVPEIEITKHQWDEMLRQLKVVWTSEPGRSYRIEFSADLNAWTPLASGLESEGLTTAYQSPALPDGVTRRFWRIVRE